MNRLFTLFALLAFATGAAFIEHNPTAWPLPAQNNHGEQSQRADRHDNAELAEKNASLLGIATDFDSSNQRNKSSQPNPTQSDSDQPKWTDRVQAYSAGIVAALTGIVLINNVFQIGAVRRSTLAAERAVVAAQRSAKAAEESSHVERAWVFFDNIIEGRGANVFVDGIPRDGHLVFVQWHNGGRTPAINVSTFINSVTTVIDAPIPGFDSPLLNTIGPILGQGRHAQTLPCFISAEDMALMRRRMRRIIIYSKIEYSDVFCQDERHVSETTFYLDFNGTRSDGAGRQVENVITIPVGAQNRCT